MTLSFSLLPRSTGEALRLTLSQVCLQPLLIEPICGARCPSAEPIRQDSTGGRAAGQLVDGKYHATPHAVWADHEQWVVDLLKAALASPRTPFPRRGGVQWPPPKRPGWGPDATIFTNIF